MSDTSPHSSASAPTGIRTNLHKFGYWVTGVYVLGMGVYIFAAQAKFENIEPNALGDFLAGTFSPLAFLWLVLGFLQQGHELRNSADALWLQGRELQNSVDQQRQLVDVSRQQMELEREMRTLADHDADILAQPLLQFSIDQWFRGEGKPGGTFMTIKNLGAECQSATVMFGSETVARLADIFPKGAEKAVTVSETSHDVADTHFEIGYIDARGRSQRRRYIIADVDGALEAVRLPDHVE